MTRIHLSWKALALVSMTAFGSGHAAAESLPTQAPASLVSTPEQRRPQDDRSYELSSADAAATTFDAMSSDPADTVDMSKTSRWAGVLGGAGYHIEVPPNWNGMLVMYAHGYRGEVSELQITDPSIRRHLIQKGYAWAASSYSKNSYDVRAAIEDTNALALAFGQIAAANRRPLATPSRIYIIGHSMGGHVTAASVEKEALENANHKVRYAGAVPMCGVVGDTDLFSYFAAAQLAAQALTGYTSAPITDWKDAQSKVLPQLFTIHEDKSLTPVQGKGDAFAAVIEQLTGGPRPLFELGLTKGQSLLAANEHAFGRDGTVFGVLNESIKDTRGVVYDTGDAKLSAALNANVQRLAAVPDANRLRSDGLRWVPKVNGDFNVPVVTLHTLGDLFVPLEMEQIYRQRAEAKGNGAWLVQRAIRGITHCDFTIAEQVRAFDDMTRWEQEGVKPSGDDVLTPEVLADKDYGCKFTDNTPSLDDMALVLGFRQLVSKSGLGCPTP